MASALLKIAWPVARKVPPRVQSHYAAKPHLGIHLLPGTYLKLQGQYHSRRCTPSAVDNGSPEGPPARVGRGDTCLPVSTQTVTLLASLCFYVAQFTVWHVSCFWRGRAVRACLAEEVRVSGELGSGSGCGAGSRPSLVAMKPCSSAPEAQRS